MISRILTFFLIMFSLYGEYLLDHDLSFEAEYTACLLLVLRDEAVKPMPRPGRMRTGGLLVRTKSHIRHSMLKILAFIICGFIPSLKGVACAECLHRYNVMVFLTQGHLSEPLSQYRSDIYHQ